MTTIELLEEVREDVKGIAKILSGNGEVGLCEQVRANETAIEKHVAVGAKNKLTIREWIPIIVGGIAFLGMVLNLLKPDQFIKLLTRLIGMQ